MIISKTTGKDDDTGLDVRVDIINININLKNKTIDVLYEKNLVSKSGKVVSKQTGVYTRKNEPAIIESKPSEKDPEVFVDVEIAPAKNKFDELAESQVGQMIKAMLENDLNNYPNL